MKNPYLSSPEFRAKHEAMRAAGRRRRAEFEAALRVAEAASEPQVPMTPEEFLRILEADPPFPGI
jgi:hypothetical protein